MYTSGLVGWHIVLIHGTSISCSICKREQPICMHLTFGFGIRPLGPSILPNLTNLGIISGVARHALKFRLLPLLSSSSAIKASDPSTSAPVGNTGKRMQSSAEDSCKTASELDQILNAAFVHMHNRRSATVFAACTSSCCVAACCNRGVPLMDD